MSRTECVAQQQVLPELCSRTENYGSIRALNDKEQDATSEQTVNIKKKRPQRVGHAEAKLTLWS
ncbi:hypothetical protein [Bradyrhizobium tropiciagri]|uniref:hypothetical protein n=1 Tax=Bradyrhizobium tropiciagri TaxID=312253 RepID=UPI00067C905C|nr:hypothetical protein [Bradyrhizobium tropiciagri]